MEFFKPNSTIDFMGARRWTALFSGIVIIGSLLILFFNGLQWGLDFTGGLQIEVSYQQSADLDEIRETLDKADFPEATVQHYDSPKNVLIRISPRADMDQSTLIQTVMKALPGAKQQAADFVGPQVGKEWLTKGALAIIFSLFATMIYIALRFEYRFALSAATALFHDPIFILGIFSLFKIEFDLTALAAILAVIGYSLNDTIVVFDRVRENFLKIRQLEPIQIMNLSINQTLSRTIITSILTLVVALALFIYGGETIHGFALVLILGITVGTYSSIYVAGTLAIALGLDRKDLMPKPKLDPDAI